MKVLLWKKVKGKRLRPVDDLQFDNTAAQMATLILENSLSSDNYTSIDFETVQCN